MASMPSFAPGLYGRDSTILVAKTTAEATMLAWEGFSYLGIAVAPDEGNSDYARVIDGMGAEESPVRAALRAAVVAEAEDPDSELRTLLISQYADKSVEELTGTGENFDRRTRLVVGASNSDHATFAAALAEAVSGTEILLRPGVHNISGANTIPAGVIVRGLSAASGSGAAILQGSFETTVSALTLQAGSSLVDVQIKNTSATGGTVGVPVAADIRGAGASVRGCIFSGPWSQAILAYYSTDISITDCTFVEIGKTTTSTPGDAINLYGVNGATISGCLVRDCRQNALYVNNSAKNVSIVGNTIRGCPEGIQVRVGCQSVSIVGNIFDIKGASGVYSVGIIVQTQSTDTIIANNTFRTTAGSTMPVAAIFVDDRAHRTIIEGNTIQGAGFAKGIALNNTSIGGNESIDCVIANNTVLNAAGMAIDVGPNHHGAIVTGNRVLAPSGLGIYAQGNRMVVTGNVITSPAGTHGINATGAYCSITGNVVTNAVAGAGIACTGTDNTIVGNTSIGNATYGIHDAGNSNVITGNNCGGNTDATLDIYSSGAASKVVNNIGRYTVKNAD